MSEIKLLPCPFCGGEAKMNERYREGIANRKMYWVSCKKCGASQPYHSLAGYRRSVGAIGQWNTRKPMQEIVERLEEELDDCRNWSDIEEDYYLGMCQGLQYAICHVKEVGRIE